MTLRTLYRVGYHKHNCSKTSYQWNRLIDLHYPSSHNHGSVENGCISKYEFPPSFTAIISTSIILGERVSRISKDLFPVSHRTTPSKKRTNPLRTVSMRELPSTQNSKRLGQDRKIFDVKTLVTLNKVMENTTPAKLNLDTKNIQK